MSGPVYRGYDRAAHGAQYNCRNPAADFDDRMARRAALPADAFADIATADMPDRHRSSAVAARAEPDSPLYRAAKRRIPGASPG